MWWPTHARPSFARANVFFSSAPQASRCRPQSTGSGSEPGTNPRERRRNTGRVRDHPHDGVVGARLDRAVVQEEEVGDVGEPRARVVVLVGDRLVGDVAAGHHERLPNVIHQQVVERRVRQHHAELRRAGRHRRRHARARAPAARARSAAPATAAAPRRPRSVATRSRAAAAVAAISANGLSSRCLRARSSPPRPRPRARQARWKPPRPLTATIAPSRSAGPPPRPDRPSARRRPLPRPRTRAAHAGRSPGRRSAGRGSAGPPGPRTRRGRPRTCRSRPSSCSAGRTGRRARS